MKGFIFSGTIIFMEIYFGVKKTRFKINPREIIVDKINGMKYSLK